MKFIYLRQLRYENLNKFHLKSKQKNKIKKDINRELRRRVKRGNLYIIELRKRFNPKKIQPLNKLPKISKALKSFFTIELRD